MNIEGRCYTQTDCFTCITPYICFEVFNNSNNNFNNNR